MIIFEFDDTLFKCEHGRDCVLCPNKLLRKATECLQLAADIFEHVHNRFNHITVKSIYTSHGNTNVTLIREDNDHI